MNNLISLLKTFSRASIHDLALYSWDIWSGYNIGNIIMHPEIGMWRIPILIACMMIGDFVITGLTYPDYIPNLLGWNNSENDS